MTHLLSNQTLTRRQSARPALFAAMLLATALTSNAPAVAQIGGGEQQLTGSWSIQFLVDGGSGTTKTSGIFNRDGSMFVQNVLPNVLPGMLIMHGTGEWSRSRNGDFDLTWIYPVVSAMDGTYIGEFKDLARIHHNSDGTMGGDSTWAFTLANGTFQFGGVQRLKLVRVRVEPMP